MSGNLLLHILLGGMPSWLALQAQYKAVWWIKTLLLCVLGISFAHAGQCRVDKDAATVFAHDDFLAHLDFHLALGRDAVEATAAGVTSRFIRRQQRSLFSADCNENYRELCMTNIATNRKSKSPMCVNIITTSTGIFLVLKCAMVACFRSGV